ncbi:MAG: NADPH:quinone reductase [Roseobacter sp.]|jgi:NADPH2:quinone reductase|nr:NADPH:quinone reductase [Roseobacter sp.]
MRAITYSAYGPAETVLTLADLPDPRPGPGDVLVALVYSGVNPSDVKRRAGARPGETELPYPAICPHSDGAGTIVAVGEGVDRARIGERVWVWNAQFGRPMGTAAEAIALPSEQAVALPEAVSLETGASLGIPGLTAAHVVFGAGNIEGKTLLIHGGNGSVGHLAVQLARWGGARVITTARPEGFDRCRAAGAHAVLDYRSPTLAQEILEVSGGAKIERIVDVEFGENIAVNTSVIADCGTIAAYGSAKNMTPQIPFGPLLFAAVTIDFVLIYILKDNERARAIDLLHRALVEGVLTCPVAKIFALGDTAGAHIAVERAERTGAILVNTTS